jgi:release factor glutamine methyltransferase
VSVDTVQADLLSSLRPGTIDILLFNPPYVPSSSLPTITPPQDTKEDAFGEESRLLELSYAGGDDGMEVTRRFLEQLPDALSLHGVAYLLLCQQNKPLLVIRDIEACGIFEACVVGTSGKSSGWERLCILRITRKTLE